MITLEHRDGVGILWLDTPGQKVNMLNVDALRQMEALFDEIQAEPSCLSAAIISRKPHNFLAGVDISLFTSLSPAELRAVTEAGQRFFNRVANFPKPVLAAVHRTSLTGRRCAPRYV